MSENFCGRCMGEREDDRLVTLTDDQLLVLRRPLGLGDGSCICVSCVEELAAAIVEAFAPVFEQLREIADRVAAIVGPAADQLETAWKVTNVNLQMGQNALDGLHDGYAVVDWRQTNLGGGEPGARLPAAYEQKHAKT